MAIQHLALVVLFLCVAQAEELATIKCPLKECDLSPTFSLQCSHAGCTEIPTKLNSRITSLKLQMNKITQFPEDRLNYTKLEELDVSDNNITDIPRWAFYSLELLETLILSRNNIKTLKSTSFFGMTNLRHLYLNGNLLTSLTNSVFFPLSMSLKILDISDNFINTLDHNALTDLRSLETLHFENNRLKALENPHLLGLRQLAELYFDRNQISEIQPGTFRDCSKLVYMDLSYNNFSTLHTDTFKGGLTALQSLNLHSNRLLSLEPGLFQPLSALKQLHLDYNPLVELPNVLPQSLEKLTMTNMPHLAHIGPDTFARHPNFKKAYLSENKALTHVDPSAFGNKNSSVRLLDLSDNALSSLPGDLVNWKNLEYLDLSGNPWNCDCNMEWTVEVYMNDESRQRIKCRSPAILKGRSVADLRYTDFTCKNQILRQPATIALIVLTCVAVSGAILLIVLRSRKNIKEAIRTKQQSGYKALYNSADDSSEVKKILPGHGLGSSEVVHFDRYSEERKFIQQSDDATEPDLV